MKPDEGSPREGHVPNLLSEKYQEARRLERYISIYVCSVCSTVHQGENNIKWGQNEIGERERTELCSGRTSLCGRRDLNDGFGTYIYI